MCRLSSGSQTREVEHVLLCSVSSANGQKLFSSIATGCGSHSLARRRHHLRLTMACCPTLGRLRHHLPHQRWHRMLTSLPATPLSYPISSTILLLPVAPSMFSLSHRCHLSPSSSPYPTLPPHMPSMHRHPHHPLSLHSLGTMKLLSWIHLPLQCTASPSVCHAAVVRRPLQKQRATARAWQQRIKAAMKT